MSVITITDEMERRFRAIKALKNVATQRAALHDQPRHQDYVEIDRAFGSPCLPRGDVGFWSAAVFDPDQLRDAMSRVQYNYFDREVLEDVLSLFPENAEFQPAREGSVAIYVHSVNGEPLKLPSRCEQRGLYCDECDYKNENLTLIRVWWD